MPTGTVRGGVSFEIRGLQVGVGAQSGHPVSKRSRSPQDPEDLEGLRTAPILALARSLADAAGAALPKTLLERLNDQEADLVSRISQRPAPPAPPDGCVYALKRLRYERQRAELQREIDRLQELGASGDDARIDALWRRKEELVQRLEALGL